MADKRLTHCPETGRPLDGLDIRAHCENLWPERTPDLSMSDEAKRRKKLLLEEADARDTEQRTRKG